MASTDAAGSMVQEGSEEMQIDMSAFMDVVYSYNCKFCSFTCTSSDEINRHVMANHVADHLRMQSTITKDGTSSNQSTTLISDVQTVVEEASKNSSACQTEGIVQQDSNYEEREEEQMITENEEGVTQSTETRVTPVESGGELRELFLCGQCNLGFTSIDECKSHMLQDHNVSISAMEVKAEHPESDQAGDVAMPANMVSVGTQSNTHKKPGRKRKSEMKEKPIVDDKDEEEMEFKMDAPVLIFNMRDSENPEKRKVKPPKALVEDYYLGRRKHKKRRQPREPYDIRCEVQGCHAKFKTEDSKIIHMSCHLELKDQGVGKFFKCLKCSAFFQNWRLTAKHLWKEHAIDADLYKCYHCEFRADTLQRLETHEQVHSDQKPFVCKTCGKGFKQQAQLKNHDTIHSGRKEETNTVSEKWYHSKICGICNKTFSSQKSMRKHVEVRYENSIFIITSENVMKY